MLLVYLMTMTMMVVVLRIKKNFSTSRVVVLFILDDGHHSFSKIACVSAVSRPALPEKLSSGRHSSASIAFVFVHCLTLRNVQR